MYRIKQKLQQLLKIVFRSSIRLVGDIILVHCQHDVYVIIIIDPHSLWTNQFLYTALPSNLSLIELCIVKAMLPLSAFDALFHRQM